MIGNYINVFGNMHCVYTHICVLMFIDEQVYKFIYICA